MTDKIVVFNTCGSEAEAARLARALVEGKLAACVTVISQARSFYRWKGKVNEDEERLLMIKTSRRLFDKVRAAIESTHSYDLPEVIAVPVTEGSAGYLSWLEGELEPEEAR